MNNTLQKLLEIKSDLFEILVSAYLRRKESRLSHLIATGINENGEPIPCPVDNIIHIAGNPPICVSVATTTIEYKDLRGKWLGKNIKGEHKKGDIEKAIETFNNWKSNINNLHCQLYIATNKLLKSDVNLYLDAIKLANTNNVEIIIIEASVLVDFLDIDSDGQYIRDVIFGIQAERLSRDLLVSIAQKSLKEHQKIFSFSAAGNADTHEIKRSIHDKIIHLLESTSKPIIGIIGPSGFGKSTLLRQIGKTINENNGIAFWIPANELSFGLPLNTIIINTLRRFYPSLGLHSDEDFIDIAESIPGGIKFLLDDVNRINPPHDIISVLEYLARSSDRVFQWIVPIWPNQLLYPSNTIKENEVWDFIELMEFNETERQDFAKLVSSSQYREIYQIIDSLNGDPFLCGFALSGPLPNHHMRQAKILRAVFDSSLREMLIKTKQNILPTVSLDEFYEAIDKVIDYIILHKNPEPKWKDIRLSIGNHFSNILYSLTRTNQIAWIDSSKDSDIWKWKHSRLRDLLIARRMSSNIIENIDNILPINLIQDISYPGFAEALALITLFVPDSTIYQVIRIISEHQPLALAEILRLNILPEDLSIQEFIFSSIHQIISGYDEREYEFTTSLPRFILDKLSQTDNQAVLPITDNLPRFWFIWCARLRNGDITSGLEWIKREEWRGFLPSIRFSFIENAIELLSDIYRNNQDLLISELINAIKIKDLRNSAIVLGSYIRYPNIAQRIWEYWMILPESERIDSLASIVWLLSRIEDSDVESRLEPALLLSLKLSNEREKPNISGKRYWQFQEPLRLSSWRGFTSTGTIAWVNILNRQEELRKELFWILGGIDHPDALEFYIHWQTKYHHGFGWDVLSESLDPLAEDLFKHKIPIIPESRVRVWNIVQSNSDLEVRKLALGFWKRSAQQKDLHLLQSISSDDPLFDDVLKVRLKLKDRTATSILIEKMNSRPARWCGYMPFLAHEEGVFETLLSVFELALDPNNEDYGWSNSLIIHLPLTQVKILIQNKKEFLLKASRVWPSIWCSGEPEALRFIQQAVQLSIPAQVEHFFAGIYPKSISPQMLDSLIPIIDKFPKLERHRLTRHASRFGYIAWVNDYMSSEINEEENWHSSLFMKEGILAKLDKISKSIYLGPKQVHESGDLFILQEFLRENRQFLSPSIIDILKYWVSYEYDDNKIIVSSMIILSFGENIDIKWWEDQKTRITTSDALIAWQNALYILKRNQWQEININLL
ncbi:NACHT domain-containing protein [Herpetosiphon llansteffanensis]|uniref:NACHT domain-containing protein n=1 Tax=Herpetosiphon llansteffanensis TaxID=2094568 RepID=UPI000D7BDB5B|nr:ATP-binding protein [Herpetosiphon llansteffanensis]